MRVCDATCSVGVGDSSSRGLRQSEGTLGSPRAWSVGRITSPQGEACGERALAPPGQLRGSPKAGELGTVGRVCGENGAGICGCLLLGRHSLPYLLGRGVFSDVLIKVEAGSGPGRMISALP